MVISAEAKMQEISPEEVQQKLAGLPDYMSKQERIGWEAVFTSPGAGSWPGECTVEKCRRTAVSEEGTCTRHWYEGKRRTVKLG